MSETSTWHGNASNMHCFPGKNGPAKPSSGLCSRVSYRVEPDYCLPVDYMQELLKGAYDTILEAMGIDADDLRHRELYGKCPDHSTQERVCAVVMEAYVRENMGLRLYSLNLDGNVFTVRGDHVPSEAEVREMLRFLGVADEEIEAVDIDVVL